jgi:DNA-binding beta-propeller fold protein YncE
LPLLAALAIAAAPLGAAAAATPSYGVVDHIPAADGGWDYLRIDQVHDRILIPRGTSVTAIDLKSKAMTTGLVPGGRQHIALPVNQSAEMLVTNGADNTAIFVNAVTGAVLAAAPTAKGPDSATVDPKTGYALVMGHAAGDITLINTKSHQVVGTISVGGALEEAAADGAGRAFVNIEDKNEIAAVDIPGQKVTARWPLAGCDGPTGLAYNAHDKLLIAACNGATAILRPSDGKVLQLLPTGKGADGAAYDARRNLAFIPAGRDGTLSVIAFDKGVARIAQTVPTQVGARTIAEDDRDGRVYLPTAKYGPPSVAGGRPTLVPGSFEILVVGPK